MATKFCYQPVFDFNGADIPTEGAISPEDVNMICNEVAIKIEPKECKTAVTEIKKPLSTITADPFLSNAGNYKVIENYGRYNADALGSPTNRKKTGGRKERTPRTLLKLMERHRHNERVRHHTLNERLRVICQFVPGSGEDGRETKVVMMQRIISYIAYLENTIAHLRLQLGLSADPSLSPLTIQLRKQIDEFSKLAVVPDIDGATQIKRPRFENNQEVPRRYKISSPTVDSTTDIPSYHRQYYNLSQESSQDSQAPSSTYYSFNTDHSLPHWLDEPILQSNEDDLASLFEPVPVFEKQNYFQPIVPDTYLTREDINMNECLFEPIQDSFTRLPSQPSSVSSKHSVYSPDQTTRDILGESIQQTFGLKNNDDVDQDYLTSMVISPDRILTIDETPSTSQEETDNKTVNQNIMGNLHQHPTSSGEDHNILEPSTSQNKSNNNLLATTQEQPICVEVCQEVYQGIVTGSIQGSTIQPCEVYEEKPSDSAFDHPTLIANHEETVTSNLDDTEEKCMVWSSVFKNKRKQYTPAKRDPFQETINFSSQEDSNDHSMYETPKTFTAVLESGENVPNSKPPSRNSDLITINEDHVSPTAESVPNFLSFDGDLGQMKSVVEPVGANPGPCRTYVMTSRPTSSIQNIPILSKSVSKQAHQALPIKMKPVAFINIQSAPVDRPASSVTLTNSNNDTMTGEPFHHVPYNWRFHSMNDTAGKKYNIKATQPPTIIKIHRPQVPQVKENQPVVVNKLDLRKTSWMNGFMMFSRLNRKHFINANPGVNTSQISKLMGQTWRTMSEEAQQPYKDKAMIFLKETPKVEDQSDVEKKTNRINIVKICPSNIKLEPQKQPVPLVYIPNTTSLQSAVTSTNKPKTTSTTHPIYNSQRWMYL